MIYNVWLNFKDSESGGVIRKILCYFIYMIYLEWLDLCRYNILNNLEIK